MKGKFERDGNKRIKCDRCGKAPIYSKASSSRLMLSFISSPFSSRKQFYLCYACTTAFSQLATLERTR